MVAVRKVLICSVLILDRSVPFCRVLVLVLDVIVHTCRVLVEQEHLLDLCREQRYDLAEHRLERMPMMTNMMMMFIMMMMLTESPMKIRKKKRGKLT